MTSAVEPGNPIIKLADALRAKDNLWDRLCAAVIRSAPADSQWVHGDAGALIRMLNMLACGLLHKDLQAELVAVGNRLLGNAIVALERHGVAVDNIEHWCRLCGSGYGPHSGLRFHNMSIDDDGEYPPHLYDPDDMTLVPVVIPEEAEKAVWMRADDGTVSALPV